MYGRIDYIYQLGCAYVLVKGGHLAPTNVTGKVKVKRDRIEERRGSIIHLFSLCRHCY